MICPKCLMLMKAEDNPETGVSDSTVSLYETAEIKYCPICGRVVQETYRCDKYRKRIENENEK